jgi:hypothetical protein
MPAYVDRGVSGALTAPHRIAQPWIIEPVGPTTRGFNDDDMDQREVTAKL